MVSFPPISLIKKIKAIEKFNVIVLYRYPIKYSNKIVIIDKSNIKRLKNLMTLKERVLY